MVVQGRGRTPCGRGGRGRGGRRGARGRWSAGRRGDAQVGGDGLERALVGGEGLEHAAAWTWRRRDRGLGGGGRERSRRRREGAYLGVADAVVVEVAGAVSRRGGRSVAVVREERPGHGGAGSAARDLAIFGN